MPRRISHPRRFQENLRPLSQVSNPSRREDQDLDRLPSDRSRNIKSQPYSSFPKRWSSEEVKLIINVVRAIAQDARLNYEDNNELDRKNSGRTLRFSSDALLAIHEALESSVCSLFEDSYLCTMHAKRMTLFDKDIALARRIRGDKF